MQAQSVQPTVVTVASTVAKTGVKRFGLNLGTETYWDSGMMLKNLVSRNPGFEGEMWQSILHCVPATTTTCRDDNGYSVWPANFFSGATGEWMTGNLTGSTVTISSSTVAGNAQGAGISVTYPAMTQAPSSGDYLVVRMNVPGNALAGWWPYTQNGATMTTELTDLSPNSPGKQALLISAAGSSQFATLSSYLDTTAGRSFLQLHGAYTLTFRAKGVGGSNTLLLGLKRTPASGAAAIPFFSQSVVLTNTWQDYTYTFNANDTGTIGNLVLSFQLSAASALLDDVSLVPAATGVVNDTAFRDEVVTMLNNVQPGILRYMDSGTNWGSSIDNLLAVPFARQRAGYSNWNTESDDIPIGLPDFLTLCEQVGSEPWFTMPTGMGTAEMTNLMEYLGGSTSTVYGALRATLGHPVPWTTTFSRIHLEFGNEVWNTANPGATMTDATAYATRMNLIFKTARSSPWYSSTIYDLVGDGWAALPYYTQTVLSTATQLDTIDAAPYLFYSFNDASSNEAIFGPMFAEPELFDSVAGGLMQQQVAAASSAGKKLSLYEVNLSTNSGTVSQSAINTNVPSLGAGLANIDHMLLMLRDLGITDQNMFALPGYANFFSGSTTNMTTPLWGSVVDMGNTNRMRPSLIAESLANTALMPTMLKTSQTGANPVWNQALSSNDNVALNGAHYLQSFAFTDGSKASLILLNLHRTSALPVALSGTWAPTGAVSMSTMAASAINATNEDATNVTVSTQSLTLNPGAQLSLAPYTMTVLTWQLKPVSLTTVTCADNPVALNGVTQCTSDIAITNGASPAVTWSASVGSISSTGMYVAPATLPANNQATITATSVQDPTQTASMTLTVAPPGATAISLNCGSTSLAVSTQATCIPSVTGVGTFNNGVNWTTTAGTINAAGTVTAPATTGTAVITATSQNNPALTASVTLTIVPQSLAISSVQLTNITPTSMTVSWNAGTATANSGVDYGLTTSYGQTTAWVSTLTADPTFTLTGLTPNTTYSLLAYSTSGGKTVTSAFTGTTPPVITISPVTCAGSTVYTGSTDACTATMSDGSAIAWTASLGSISPAGVYTPPSSLSVGTSVTITATSVTSPTKTATLRITAVPSGVSSVWASCTPSTLIVSTQTQCVATVNGMGNYSSSVLWSTSAGSIDSSGLLTAPATAGTVTVTAVSTMTPKASATTQATVTNIPIISNIQATNITTSSATISWNSGALSNNGVDYGPTLSYGSVTAYIPLMTATPSFTLTGLQPNTTYYILVYSKVVNTTVTAKFQFTTAPAATVSTMTSKVSGIIQATVISIPTIPIISNIQTTNITSSSATISWNSGALSNNGVDYGPTLSYGKVTTWIPLMTATPSFTLTGLQANTTYYLVAYSQLGNTTVISKFTVKTAGL